MKRARNQGKINTRERGGGGGREGRGRVFHLFITNLIKGKCTQSAVPGCRRENFNLNLLGKSPLISVRRTCPQSILATYYVTPLVRLSKANWVQVYFMIPADQFLSQDQKTTLVRK